LAELNILDEFKLTLDEKEFLRYDAGENNPERWLIFTTSENLVLLDACPNWLFDGTFRLVKDVEGIYQLASIHILNKGKNLPMVYALLPRKTEATYTTLFEYLRDKCGLTRPPTSLNIDFELAIRNTAVAV
jgi:hypothetical protein